MPKKYSIIQTSQAAARHVYSPHLSAQGRAEQRLSGYPKEEKEKAKTTLEIPKVELCCGVGSRGKKQKNPKKEPNSFGL